jgi:hypothetical protein
MPFNLPIFLTWLRIAMIPLVLGLFYLPESWLSVPARDTWACIAFVVAALTDWFDGWLAGCVVAFLVTGMSPTSQKQKRGQGAHHKASIFCILEILQPFIRKAKQVSGRSNLISSFTSKPSLVLFMLFAPDLEPLLIVLLFAL